MAEVLNKIQYDKKPEKASKQDMDPAVLKQMLMSPSSGSMEGNITQPAKTAELEKEANDTAKMLVSVNSKKVQERVGKYKEELFDKAKKNPASFEVEVKPGEWMNLKEAIAKGWNPKTGEFDLEPLTSKKDEILAGLPENERAKLSQMIDPANLELSAMQGEEMGLDPSSPMLKANGNTAPMPPEGAMPPEGMPPEGAMPPEAGGQPAIDPAMMAMLGGANG